MYVRNDEKRPDADAEIARLGDEAAFGRMVEGYRRDPHVHCYRMLGSLQRARSTL